MKKCKVYSDGGHYIAMRPTKGISGPRRKRPPEEPIVVEDELNDGQMVPPKKESSMQEITLSEHESVDQIYENTDTCIENNVNAEENSCSSNDGCVSLKTNQSPKNVRISTRSDEFLKWYRESFGMRKKAQRAFIVSKLTPYFANKNELNAYVDKKIGDRKRAEIIRRIRCLRRAALHELTYFCTFTYDSKKITEAEFEKKLLMTLSNFASRKKWKYMGTWERGGETDRLHFHAIMYIPKDKMTGILENKREFDVQKKRMVERIENSFFKDRFGRNTFQIIDGTALSINTAVGYIVKYIEKTGGKIICSKGLRTFLETDIDNDDILAPLREYDNKKYILADDFKVYKDGIELGTISPSVLARAKTVN